MTPAEAFHPSTFIREEMDARGWSIDALVQAMQPKDAREHAVLTLAMGMYLEIGAGNPPMRMGDEMAAQLGTAFGTSAELWTNLEGAWLEEEKR